MFFLVCTNFRWAGGRGRDGIGAQTFIQLRLEQEKPTKVATLSPYHTTRPGRHLANDGSSSKSLPAQMVPCILLTVTSQGRQNALQKSRPAHIYWTVETLCIDSY